jgi:hypothetical protein
MVENHPALGKAKVIGHIEITVCPTCFLYNENHESHHRDQHGPEGCNFCRCPKKNLRLPQIKPKQ